MKNPNRYQAQYDFRPKYSAIIEEIKLEKGQDYQVTLEDLKDRLSIKDYPWQSSISFTA